MTDFLSIEEIEKLAEDPHITADELDILVSKTRELTTLKQHEIDRLKGLLSVLHKKLGVDEP